MTYAMTLDNAWELMTEDEMYDVNGGITFEKVSVWGVLISWELRMSNSELVTLLGLIAAGTSMYGGLIKLGLAAAAAATTAGILLITFGVWSAFAALGAGAAIGYAPAVGVPYSRPTW